MNLARSDGDGPAIRVIMLPKDTNSMGTIFGGVILSYIDLAAASEARRYSGQRFVTKAMHAVEFLAPVHLGDLVSFYAQGIRVGRTSMTVKVNVQSDRLREGEPHSVKVTEAEVVLVAIDTGGRPTPVHHPTKGNATADQE
jgi:acyl-CoA thioesterase YciA